MSFSAQNASELTLYSKADVSRVWNADAIGCCTRVGAGVFSSQIGQSQTGPTCAVATAQDLPSATWALQNKTQILITRSDWVNTNYLKNWSQIGSM